MKTKDLLIIGGGAVVAYLLIKQVTKVRQDPYLVAETSAAQSLTQKRKLPGNRIENTPYVETRNSPYKPGEQVVVVQKTAPLSSDPSKTGLAVTSLTEKEWAALSFNDRRAIEKGQFEVTDQGMLITGWNRLISLLPDPILKLIG